jgi:hypothetical protein
MSLKNRLRFSTVLSKESIDTLDEINKVTKTAKSQLLDIAIELLKQDYVAKGIIRSEENS